MVNNKSLKILFTFLKISYFLLHALRKIFLLKNHSQLLRQFCGSLFIGNFFRSRKFRWRSRLAIERPCNSINHHQDLSNLSFQTAPDVKNKEQKSNQITNNLIKSIKSASCLIAPETTANHPINHELLPTRERSVRSGPGAILFGQWLAAAAARLFKFRLVLPASAALRRVATEKHLLSGLLSHLVRSSSLHNSRHLPDLQLPG